MQTGPLHEQLNLVTELGITHEFFYRAYFKAVCGKEAPRIMRLPLLFNLSEIMLAAYALVRDQVLARLERIRGRFDVAAFVWFFEELLPLAVLGQSLCVRHDRGDNAGDRCVHPANGLPDCLMLPCCTSLLRRQVEYLRRLVLVYTITRRKNYKLSTLAKLS
jgi:hypothetical protein